MFNNNISTSIWFLFVLSIKYYKPIHRLTPIMVTIIRMTLTSKTILIATVTRTGMLHIVVLGEGLSVTPVTWTGMVHVVVLRGWFSVMVLSLVQHGGLAVETVLYLGVATVTIIFERLAATVSVGGTSVSGK